MKFISAAIVLLASAAVVKSLPVYDDSYESSTSDDSYDSETATYDSSYETATSDSSYETSTYDSSYETSTSDDWNDYYASSTTDYYYPTTTSDYYPESTPTDYCAGFKISSPSGSDLSYDEDSQQEVAFDWGNSSIKEVEYVDVVKAKDQEVVDQWATGPWNSSDPKTGLHSIYVSHESGDYQFLVYAATEDHQHCTYLSDTFKVVSKSGNDYHHHDDYETTTTTYYDATPTTDGSWDSTPTYSESSYDDSDFTPYQP
jgi:hypothetical protein